MNINKDYLGCFGPMKTVIKPTAIIIHHTCTSSPKRTRSVLNSKHESTHFEVDKDGTIYQYRECNLLASHCGSCNSHCIGIDVTHLENADFPAVQVAAVKELVEFLCGAYNIPHEVHNVITGVYPHSGIGSTKCPNGFPMNEL